MKKIKILKQSMMLKVLYSMLPVLFVGVYYFGWRIVGLLFVSCLFAFLTEFIMIGRKEGKITMACFVTASLYTLSLPPTLPFWIAAVGIVVAIFFGRDLFGGFGKNVFNPAIVGRAFIYICFPIEMTSKFVPVFDSFPGGFIRWNLFSDLDYMSYANGFEASDVITSATPLLAMKNCELKIGLFDLIKGNIGQTFFYDNHECVLAAGSCGEVCSIAIIVSLIYLIFTKTVQFRLFLGTILGALFLSFVMVFLNESKNFIYSILFTLFSGGLLYASVFMVTEPITAPRMKSSQWVYAVFIGMMIVLFRSKSVFAGGVAFSILLGNALAPSLDICFRKLYRK